MSIRPMNLLAACAVGALAVALTSGAHASTITFTTDGTPPATISATGGGGFSNQQLVISNGGTDFSLSVQFAIDELNTPGAPPISFPIVTNYSLYGTINVTGVGSTVGGNFTSSSFSTLSLNMSQQAGDCDGGGTLPGLCAGGNSLFTGTLDSAYNNGTITNGFSDKTQDGTATTVFDVVVANDAGLALDLEFSNSGGVLSGGACSGVAPDLTCDTTDAGVSWQVFSVPEPASLSLFGGGLLAFGAWRRRRNEKKA